MQIITLLSDFGMKDPYVAEMKAVILSICPSVKIVDISHDVSKFDIREGAFVLAQAAPYFPEGTIHLSVVDPGVGTERRPIIIQTNHSRYVGPDNGLLMLSARKERIRDIHEITNPEYVLGPSSRTFHGRDVFSCAAAHLANGIPISAFGPRVDKPVLPRLAKPRLEGNKLVGEVLYIDNFGNIITNLSINDLNKEGIRERGLFKIKLKDKVLMLRFCVAYGDVSLGTPLAIIGSSDFLEVAVNQGNAAESYDINLGDPIQVMTSARGRAGLK